MALSLSLSRVKRQKWVPIALIGLGVVWLGALAFQTQVVRGVRLWFIGAERHLGAYQRIIVAPCANQVHFPANPPRGPSTL